MKYFITILYLMAGMVAFAQEPQGDSSFLIPADYFKSKGFSHLNSNKYLNFYSKRNVQTSVDQIYDIRWLFNSEKEAIEHLNKNIAMISEGGIEYKKTIELPNATNIHIYRETFSVSQLYKGMSPSVQWYIVFVVDKAIIKIFTQGEYTTLNEPYLIALEAAKHVSQKFNKPIDKKTYSIPELQIKKELLKKIIDANVIYNVPPGYENSDLDKDLKNYFDQEYKFPGEDLTMRTLIVVPNESGDTSNYKEFCKMKNGASMSIFLNIFMPVGGNPFDKINYKETKDSMICKKKFNGDYMVEARAEINKKSKLGKGYKYAYFIAFYKRGYGDCYTVYFANDVEELSLFSQMTQRVFRFK